MSATPASEPADPRRPDQGDRRGTRLAPRDLDLAADPLYECGCGDCPEYVDPLADHPRAGRQLGDTPIAPTDLTETARTRVAERAPEGSVLAADVCPEPRPVTVRRAGEIWTRYVGHADWGDVGSEGHSQLDRGLALYRDIHEMDRGARAVFGDSLTTCLYSLRLSPIGTDNGWLSPMRLAARITAERGAILTSLKRRLDHPDVGRAEYISAICGTETCGTPHLHIAVWADDPDDALRLEYDGARKGLASVVDEWVETVTGARRKDHPIGGARASDALVLDHDPAPSGEYTPDEPLDVKDATTHVRDGSWPASTAMATYLGAQLPRVAVRDWLDPEEEAGPYGFVRPEVAATRWAHGQPWVTTSRGFPLTDEEEG